MPVVALNKDDSLVTVEDVDSADGCRCPDCDEAFGYIRDAHDRAGSRVCAHFVHRSASDGGCGESHMHLKMKAVAAETAGSTFSTATVEIEEEVAGRWADVCVTFPDTFYPFGDGICIECQYKNKQKDVNNVEEAFASEGYSTLWLYEQQFDGYTVNLLDGSLTKGWLKQIPERSEWSGVTEPAEMWPSECDDFFYTQQETKCQMPLEWFREQLKERHKRGLRIGRGASLLSDRADQKPEPHYKDRHLRDTEHLPKKFHGAVRKVRKAKKKLPSYSERKLGRVEYRLYDRSLDLHCIGDSKEHVITDGTCVHCGVELWKLQTKLDPGQFFQLMERQSKLKNRQLERSANQR